MLIEQVRAFCIQHQLLVPGPLVVAVSGGADSLTLLHVLIQLRDEFGLVLHVATFDHRIRGEASAADVQFVQDIAARWGVPVTAGSEDVPALARAAALNLEAAAHRARYAFLWYTAAQVGASRFALGHNRDDQAETVLMHALRGSGLAGLRGMLPQTPLRDSEMPLVAIRPLLNTPRAAIDQYIRDLGIEPRIDETNADPRYTRNRLRLEILPLLETINPRVREALARTGEIARDEYAALQRTLPPLKEMRYERSVLYGVCIDRDVFLALSTAQQRLLIRSAIQQLAPRLEISFERTLEVVALVEKHQHGAWMPLREEPRKLPGEELAIRVVNGTLIIARESRYPSTCPSILPGSRLVIPETGDYTLPGSRWRLRVERLSSPGSLERLKQLGPLAVALAAGESPRLELRTRQVGDRFRPHGAMGHSQKLSDTLTNMKVQTAWRDSVPLLTINGELAWFVAPFAAGPRSRVAENWALQDGDVRTIWVFMFVPSKT